MKQSIYEPQRDIEKRITHILLYDCQVYYHFHHCIEILYVEEGSLTYQCSLGEFEITENMIVFIPSLFPHAFYPNKKTTSQTILIPDFAQEFSSRNYHILNKTDENKKILPIFNAIYDNSKEQPNILLKGLTEVLLGWIEKNYTYFTSITKKTGISIEILQYIQDNFKNKISLDEIAKRFNFNKYYFSKLFNSLFKCSLSEYINSLRAAYVEEEHRLCPDKNLTQLIFDAGFNSTSSFYRYINKPSDFKITK